MDSEAFDIEAIKVQERKYIQTRRRTVTEAAGEEKLELDPESSNNNTVGLALGGGGVRSATFNLGILQGLAHCRVLRFVDYLSTVSGGGYIGCSWLWCATHPDSGEKMFSFPFGKDRTSGDSASRRVDWIRAHGQTMTPGHGLNGWAFAGSIVMGSLITLAIAIPLVLLLFMFLSLPVPHWLEVFCNRALPRMFPLKEPHTGFTVLLALAGISFIIYGVLIVLGPVLTSTSRRWIVASTFGRSRKLFVWLGFSLMFGCVLVTVGSIPYWASALYGFANWIGSVLAVLGVSGMTIAHRFFKGKTAKGKGALVMRTGLVLAVVGLVILLYNASVGISEILKLPESKSISIVVSWLALIIGFGIAFCAIPSFIRNFRRVESIIGWILIGYALYHAWPYIGHTDTHGELLIGFGVLILSLWLGFFADINHVSMHRYYRNALLEAYFVSKEGSTETKWNEADGFKLHNLLPKKVLEELLPTASKSKLQQVLVKYGLLKEEKVDEARERSSSLPYLLINSAMQTVGSDAHKLRERGADNFLFSPLFCGSRSTVYRPTPEYEEGTIKLATAMAISGAALHPNSYATRSRPMASLLTLLNLRLGYWIGNPIDQNWKQSSAGRFLSGDLISEMSGLAIDEKRGRLMIADGGQFENLGLYELFERKCKYIVVCEAPVDQECRFEDFILALERAQVDFGVRVDINLCDLARDAESGCPFSLKRSKSAFVFGKVYYQGEGSGSDSAADHGWIVYIRASLIKDMSETVEEYASKHHTFPYDTTVDQFFDERQFEAYRELGYLVAKSLCKQQNLSGKKPCTSIRELFPKTPA